MRPCDGLHNLCNFRYHLVNQSNGDADPDRTDKIDTGHTLIPKTKVPSLTCLNGDLLKSIRRKGLRTPDPLRAGKDRCPAVPNRGAERNIAV